MSCSHSSVRVLGSHLQALISENFSCNKTPCPATADEDDRDRRGRGPKRSSGPVRKRPAVVQGGEVSF